MEISFLLAFVMWITFVDVVRALDETLTVTVQPGGRECFSQEISANNLYEIEYSVRPLYFWGRSGVASISTDIFREVPIR